MSVTLLDMITNFTAWTYLVGGELKRDTHIAEKNMHLMNCLTMFRSWLQSCDFTSHPRLEFVALVARLENQLASLIIKTRTD